MEPEFLCEQEMAADTTDLRFLDEERIVGSFSNGCVSLFRYSAAMQVDVFVQDLAKNYPPSFLTCPSFSLLSHFLCLCVKTVHWVATHFTQSSQRYRLSAIICADNGQCHNTIQNWIATSLWLTTSMVHWYTVLMLYKEVKWEWCYTCTWQTGSRLLYGETTDMLTICNMTSVVGCKLLYGVVGKQTYWGNKGNQSDLLMNHIRNWNVA